MLLLLTPVAVASPLSGHFPSSQPVLLARTTVLEVVPELLGTSGSYKWFTRTRMKFLRVGRGEAR